MCQNKLHLQVITCCIYKQILCYQGVAKKGDIVTITIGKKTSFGIVSGACTQQHEYSLKTAINTTIKLSEIYVDFLINFQYYSIQKLSYIIKYLNRLIPCNNIKFANDHELQKQFIIPNLTIEQQEALNQLNSKQFCLLYGVTGSGKGVIVIKKILSTIEKGGQVLILIPEITIAKHFSKELNKYNINHVVWNSETKNKTKFLRILNGLDQVVIGTRSTLFVPFKNLSFIAVDEEHSTSYFQSGNFSYHGRDMAIVLAQTYKIPIWLISATPSLESLYNYQQKKYHLVFLQHRFKNAKVNIKFIDPGNYLISPEILKKCQETIDQKKQVLFFCNRRALAPIIKCKNCNKRQCCKCEGFLRAHKDYYQCHKCAKIYDKNVCVFCKSVNNIVTYGFGVEKIAQYLYNKIPHSKIAVFSSDSCYSQTALTKMLNNIYNNEVNIIVGTQLISKGHTFPHLAMVVLINMDNLGIDFRVSEYGFQNLIQVIGRVGRAGNYGEIYIQRQQVNFYEKFLLEQNYFGFAQKELQNRQLEHLPPFTKMISLYIHHYQSYQNILDYLIGHESVCDIYIETRPNLLFTCKKNKYINLLTAVIDKYPYCYLEIWS